MPDSKLQTIRNILKSKIVKSALLILCIFVFYKIFIYYDPKTSIRDKKKEGKFEFILNLFKKKNKDYITDMDSVIVKATSVYPEKINPAIHALGSVDFLDKVDIVSKTAGNIVEIKAKEGEKVKKGDVLLHIDTLQLELERKKNQSALQSAFSSLSLSEEKYAKARENIEIRMLDIEKRKTQTKEAKAELTKMKMTFAGKETLYKEGGISKEEMEHAQTALITAEAKYRMSIKDWEMGMVGFRNEDIISKNIKVPDDPKEKLKLFVDINTRIDKAEVDVARSQVESAKAALTSTEELIRAATIRSPIDGVVAYVNKHVGEYVNPGAVNSPDQAILVLVNIHKVFAKLNIRESDMISVRKNMDLEFTADVYPDRKFNGKVGIINPIVDPKTHTMEVKALIRNEDRSLTPGMFVRGSIFTGETKMSLLVPSEALFAKDNDVAWIYVLNDGIALRAKVRTGSQYEDKVEILEGLNPGSIVAVEKLTQLKDGMKVRPEIENGLK
ncbi:efflux RND transporter periplasmic adaptor subunit [Leptospira mayottensis]|uniref:efflux RND transporter periplasmic adaptor subunit n=1 Tax=Leptospira mayottensis TaxID=1137606 RepID=UPI0002BF25B0|nr:efflux RND transporter periplasmic adaptor subunit [Leptospira mayottensis]AXR60321.1 efflux RND transporter periplasmic adaptor subunit [Leptospira mayottensis]AZQ03252.1 efflux RND transporter periplasmic adaptor subunit [Leptospira mayottensis 200901116]TGN00407.1 efflux RND transporter periplasmic adaptor subunit [Leptospira mayottensis]